MWIAYMGRNGAISIRAMMSAINLFSVQQGLADGTVVAIEEGLADHIWLSTNAGISYLNVKTNEIANYNHLDGIPLGNFCCRCGHQIIRRNHIFWID
jgi:hypothetical protein